jgi:ribosomal protein S12 methylthiotransferase accessory factor
MTVEAAAGTIDDDGCAWLYALLDRAAAVRLEPALGRLDWVAALPNPAAPAYVFLAGACGGVPVGGGGMSMAEAAHRLAGETAEVIAQAAPLPQSGGECVAEIDALWTGAADPARIAATDLSTDATLAVPAAAIFPALAGERRADAPPQSLGLAAGPDREAAQLAGLLELVERDAAARWWMEGVRAHALDNAIAPGLAALRAGAELPRATTLMVLSAAAGTPVICALSRDADGRGLALGLKAALTPAAAAQGAVIELLQMEIALQMAAHRAARGVATPGDAAALARAAIDAGAFPILPAAIPPPPPVDLGELVARLGADGCRVVAADLAGPHGGLAVAKVFATGLRPYPGGRQVAAADSPGVCGALM